MHLYSAAGAIAYEMESRKADYPRMIASPTFLDLLQTYATPQGEHPTIRANLGFAQKNQQFLFDDIDGIPTLDFLGAAFRDEAGKGKDLTPFVRQAWIYVQAAHAAHRAAGSEKLARKYAWLENYIRSRLAVWGLTP